MQATTFSHTLKTHRHKYTYSLPLNISFSLARITALPALKREFITHISFARQVPEARRPFQLAGAALFPTTRDPEEGSGRLGEQALSSAAGLSSHWCLLPGQHRGSSCRQGSKPRGQPFSCVLSQVGGHLACHHNISHHCFNIK